MIVLHAFINPFINQGRKRIDIALGGLLHTMSHHVMIKCLMVILLGRAVEKVLLMRHYNKILKI